MAASACRPVSTLTPTLTLTLTLICLVAVACAGIGGKTSTPASDSPAARDDAIIADVAHAHTTWTAGRNPGFEGMSVGALKARLGTTLAHTAKTNDDIELPADIPGSFDARIRWPTCIGAIRNQRKCGSCWAFGAAESFGDRLCIASKSKVTVSLSPMDMVMCSTMNHGCKGGSLEAAWDYMADTGVVSNTCLPYTAALGIVPACPGKRCFVPFVSNRKYKVSRASIVYPGTPAAVQATVMQDGPVEASFRVYADFQLYKEGVYQHVTGQFLGGHAIKILGWGVESGTPYWLCANSWGTEWGIRGYFKIKRGTDESGIESNVVGGLPTRDSMQ